MNNSIHMKSSSGGANKKGNQDFINIIRFKTSMNPCTSMAKLASEIEVNQKTIRRAVNDDYAGTLRHLLIDGMNAWNGEVQKVLICF